MSFITTIYAAIGALPGIGFFRCFVGVSERRHHNKVLKCAPALRACAGRANSARRLARRYGALPCIAMLLVVSILGAAKSYSQPGVSEEDLRQATANYQAEAKRGDPSAQFMLFFAYHQGMGVAQDSDQALKWLRAAAEQGFPDALFELGQAHLYGVLVQQNEAEGLRLLSRAAEDGLVSAHVSLGGYFMGADRGMQPRDSASAKKHLLAAADQGALDAFYYLGLMYRSGLEPEAALDADLNIDQAVYWYTLAANNGHLYAMASLGEMYLIPSFELNNPEEAFFLLKTASLAGLREANPLLEEASARIDSDTELELTEKASELVMSFQAGIE